MLVYYYYNTSVLADYNIFQPENGHIGRLCEQLIDVCCNYDRCKGGSQVT